MAFECPKPQLMIFDPKGVQYSVLDIDTVSLKPIAYLENSRIISFIDQGYGESYRNLSNVYLQLKVKLIKKENENVIIATRSARPARKVPEANTFFTDAYQNPNFPNQTEGRAMNDDDDGNGNEPNNGNESNNEPILGSGKDVTISVVNNFMHSLFSQITLTLNGKQIGQNCQNYPYRAYIENLLNFEPEAARCHLEPVIWSLDTPGHFNDLNSKNSGFITRGKAIASGEEIELCGRLHLDMFNSSKYLLNNVDVGVTFELGNQGFFLLSDDEDESTVKILDATLHIEHIKLNPEVLLSHQKILEQKNAVYNYKRIDVRNFNVAPQGNSFAVDNICIGPLPEFILFAFVDTMAYNGKRSLNPFNFEHFNVSQISLSKNGKLVDPRILKFDYSLKNPMSTHGYYYLYKQLNLHRFDRANSISRAFFDGGGFIIAYDLTQDRDNECGNVIQSGSLRLEVQLAKPLTKPITVIAYIQSDADLIIDRDRNVYPQTF